jgi:hypothetical protein
LNKLIYTWLPSLFRIVFGTAMFVGIVLAVRHGLALLIPTTSCAGRPVEPLGQVLAVALFIQLAHKTGLLPLLRVGVTLLAGLLAATVVARLATGCTPLAEWNESARDFTGMVVVFAFVIPLAHLLRHCIEHRWARAMGERTEAGDEDGHC